jgi:hypothetical protein
LPPDAITPEQEDSAQAILRAYGGHAVRMHEIDIEKLPPICRWASSGRTHGSARNSWVSRE